MSPDLIFLIANYGILIFWLLLIVAPRWRGTQVVVHSIAIPLLLGVAYTIITASVFGFALPQGGGFDTLKGVATLFGSPWALLAGWIHYLVFDLFVGAWQVRDAGRRGIPQLVIVPCLVLTLLFGPVGLMLYLLIRLGMRKGSWSLDEGTRAAG